MYTRILIPLDGSKTAEKVLPYARFLVNHLKLPIELLAVVDIAEMATHMSAEKARYLDTMVENTVRNSGHYLREVAGTFPGADTKCTVEKGKAEQAIIEKERPWTKERLSRWLPMVVRGSTGGCWGALPKRFCAVRPIPYS